MGNGVPRGFLRDDVGWGTEDHEKVAAMLQRTKGDGSPRFTIGEIARFVGMSPGKVASIQRNMEVPSTQYTRRANGPLCRDDGLFAEGNRFRANAIEGSRKLAERMRAVHG